MFRLLWSADPLSLISVPVFDCDKISKNPPVFHSDEVGLNHPVFLYEVGQNLPVFNYSKVDESPPVVK